VDRNDSSRNGVRHVVCGQLADRIGRKPVFILFQAGALLMVVLYSRITEPNTLLWVGAVMGLFVNGTNGAIFALMSEAYPTVARATAQNVLWNLARAVGALGPLAIGALAAKYSFQAAIGFWLPFTCWTSSQLYP